MRVHHATVDDRRAGRRARRGAPAVLAIVATLLLAGSAGALADPVWRIDALSSATSVAPGGTFDYFVQATNVGDTETSGAYALDVTLPPGVTLVSYENPFSPPSAFVCTGPGGSDPTGQSQISCSEETTVTPVPPITLQKLTLRVAVDPGAAEDVATGSFTISGGGAAPATTVRPIQVTTAPPTFGVAAFDGQTTANAAGDPFTQAGGHPYAYSTSLDFNTVVNPDPLVGPLFPVEATKDVTVDLPPGFVGDPTSLAQCTAGQLANPDGFEPEPLCPPTSQVGATLVRLNNPLGSVVFGPLPLFNLVPPPGVPARFGFNVAGTVVTLDARVRSGGDYGISVDAHNISQGVDIAGSTLTFWGVPSDSSHDHERACPGEANPWRGGTACPSGAPRAAFLRNPTSCPPPGVGIPTSVRMDSWENPGAFTAPVTFLSHLPPGYPAAPQEWGAQAGPSGCEKVPFDPSFTAQPEGSAPRAGSPTGFQFDLSLPQSKDPDVLGQADLKRAVVTLPEGVRLSPSSADGLAGCSSAQIALHSPDAPSCPDASRVGSVTITTPLLADPLQGSIYLATPHDNPFGNLVTIYLVAEGSGVVVKLPGQVQLDPGTGRITTTFDDTPQLPFSNVHLAFNGGPRAPLVTPPGCGTYNIQALLTPWSSTPEAPRTVSIESPFTIDADTGGQPCAPHGFSPAFTAGTQNPLAGRYSPFVLTLSREDIDQELDTMTLDMPGGLIGRIAGTPLCPDSAASTGSCGEASRVGTVAVGAGPGSSPFAIRDGRAYITGPYKGAPFGLSVVVPAVAGPFDLGNVVVRAALFIDPHTAAVKVVSDPFPRILDGVPLQLRTIQVLVDRPQFITNPTSCSEKQVLASVTSVAGTVAHVGERFQVAGCAGLRFHPDFKVATSRRTSKALGASLHVHLATGEGPVGPGSAGEANIAKVDVQLPRLLPSRLTTLQKACPAAQFERDLEGCPQGAFVGSATAHTPILNAPLSGPAILVSHGGAAFPDLVLVLQGEGVTIDLVGHTNIRKGVTFSHFEAVPDAPVSSFDLTLPEGTHSVLAASKPLCRTVTVKKRISRHVHGRLVHHFKKIKRHRPAPLLMPTTITAQNGAVLKQNTKISVTGCS
jgi:hypothetical protein